MVFRFLGWSERKKLPVLAKVAAAGWKTGEHLGRRNVWREGELPDRSARAFLCELLQKTQKKLLRWFREVGLSLQTTLAVRAEVGQSVMPEEKGSWAQWAPVAAPIGDGTGSVGGAKKRRMSP